MNAGLRSVLQNTLRDRSVCCVFVYNVLIHYLAQLECKRCKNRDLSVSLFKAISAASTMAPGAQQELHTSWLREARELRSGNTGSGVDSTLSFDVGQV